VIDLTPEQFRELGYRAVELIAQQLASLREAPARRQMTDEQREWLMNQPLPTSGHDPMEILQAVGEWVLPYPMGNNSPRFFGWVNSPTAPLAILAELLASALNPSVAGGDHAASYVEHGVLAWLKTLMGFPQESGGLLVSGGSVANLVCLGVMRHVKAWGKIREEGFEGEAEAMVVYTSSQGHSCIQKAVELLGIGNAHLRRVPVDGDYRMDIERLRAQIAADRDVGLHPVCVVASAGTVNTGAIDPLEDIANLCEQEGLWFHIDGAYGGFGILAEQTSGLYGGIERADSLAIDPHKWLYMPVECGCALVRDVKAMRDAYSLIPAYLRDDTALPWFSEFGIQQTRGFKALKLWMVLQQIGADGYRELISHDIALARMLEAKIQARKDFELIASGPLSVTCFRYIPAMTSSHEDPEAFLNTLNRRLLNVVQGEGQTFLTSTELSGKFSLRACIVNFRTTEADLEFLLDALAKAGQRVLETA
jgi:glutamate/tyrosine decarboxylase-like PLP-dependent enzyme